MPLDPQAQAVINAVNDPRLTGRLGSNAGTGQNQRGGPSEACWVRKWRR